MKERGNGGERKDDGRGEEGRGGEGMVALFRRPLIEVISRTRVKLSCPVSRKEWVKEEGEESRGAGEVYE